MTQPIRSTEVPVAKSCRLADLSPEGNAHGVRRAVLRELSELGWLISIVAALSLLAVSLAAAVAVVA